MRKAINCKECESCKHREVNKKLLFGYMFKDKPEIIPCGQRKITGMLFKKYPPAMKFALSVMLNDNLLSGKKRT